MKRKILSVLLAVTLLLGLAVPALGVETFTDLILPNGEHHWATDYIMRLAERGLFEGYGDGKVGPNDPVLVSAALALCARMAVNDEEMRLQIGADLSGQITPLLPDKYGWLEKEAATCLEIGIVNQGELTQLTWNDPSTGRTRLDAEIHRGDFARYVVRAMGLEDMTRVLSGSDLSFADADDIDPSLRPYVQLLTQWGVVTGVQEEDELYYFYPDKSLTRAECATMLERALEKMEDKNVSVEIPRYTKCKWDSGYVANVDVEDGGARRLTLQSPFTEEEETKDIILPLTTKVYLYNQYNEMSKFTSLRVGYFARVCYGEDGVTPESVRVIPVNNTDPAASMVTRVSGVCDELGPNEIVVDSAAYHINRFTLVSASGKEGDAGVIDYAANYTDAELVCDARGVVLHLALSGGTRPVSGIMTGYSETAGAEGKKATVTITDLNGSSKVYEIPEGTVVTISGTEGTLKETFKGRMITLRVKDSDPTAVQSVDVNAMDKYVQGIVQRVDYRSTVKGVDVSELGSSKTMRYDVPDGTPVKYEGADIELKDLPLRVFVTLRLEGGTVVSLEANPGYETTTGTLESIEWDPLVLTVRQGNGMVNRFTIPTEDVGEVVVTVDGNKTDITRLRTGDEVTVTVLFNRVSQVDVVTREANVAGTVQSVTQRADGSVLLEVKLTDGTTATYVAGTATTVTRDGAAAALNGIRPNETVKMLVEGDRAISIEVAGAAQSKDQVYGAIFLIDAENRELTLLVKDNVTGAEMPVKVRIPASVSVLDVTSGKSITNLNRLNLKDPIRAYGSYDANGVFVATAVIREL